MASYSEYQHSQANDTPEEPVRVTFEVSLSSGSSGSSQVSCTLTKHDHSKQRKLPSTCKQSRNGAWERDKIILDKLERDLVYYMNTSQLLPLLKTKGIVSYDEEEDLEYKHKTPRDKNKFIISLIPKKGADALKLFLECLQEETEHRGHATIAQLLQKECCGGELEAQAVSSEIHNNHSPVLTEPMAAWNAADSQCSTSPQCNVDVPQTQVQCKAKDGNSSDLEAFKHIQRIDEQKLRWLDTHVIIKDYSTLDRHTRNEARRIIHSGIMLKRKKPRFIVLLNDMLLLLKPVHSSPVIEWFCTSKFVTKPIYLFEVSVKQSHEEKSPMVCLHCKRGSDVKLVSLEANSLEAKKIWVDALGSVIQSCTMAQSSSTYTECQSQSTFSVHVLNGTDLCLPSSSTRVYCEVGINGVTQRTVAVPGTTNTKWDCKLNFNGGTSDTLEIRVALKVQNTFSSDDDLGSILLDVSVKSEQEPRVNKPFTVHLPNKRKVKLEVIY